MEVLWSATGVRQGDQIGPLLFQLTYQPTLSDAQQSASDALVTACHDNTCIQGDQQAVNVGAARIPSRYACQHQKTLVFCADTDKAPPVAAAAHLGATVASEGLVACGTALGHAYFTEEHVRRRCVQDCEQVEQVVGLLVDPRTEWCVLHNCVQHREVHLPRNTLWVFLAQPCRERTCARHVRHSQSAPAQRVAEGTGCAPTQAWGHGSTVLQRRCSNGRANLICSPRMRRTG